MELWRDDLLEAALEVDAQLRIKAAGGRGAGWRQ